MEKQKTIENINLLGGHPVLDYVNTVDSRGDRWGPEFLNTYEDLARWAWRVDVIGAAEVKRLIQIAHEKHSHARASLLTAREFRETVYRLFMSEVDERPVLNEDLSLLSKHVQRAAGKRLLVAKTPTIIWDYVPADELDAIVDRIAWLAAELLTSKSDRREIRACQGPNCGWLFLDHSRNGHRRWCSDKTCGSHARVRKFRAAHVS